MKGFKKRRNMKIYGMSGYNYKSTPTIMLKGQWLKKLGFEIGGYVTVSCENGRLVITPDAEMAALKEAEAASMEREKKFPSVSPARQGEYPAAGGTEHPRT